MFEGAVGVDLISIEQWMQWNECESDDNGKYTLLPYIRRVELTPEGLLPLFWDGLWEEASLYSCILESGKGGRYTIVGLHPTAIIEGKGNRALVREPLSMPNANAYPNCNPNELPNEEWVIVQEFDGAPLEQLRSWTLPWRGPKPEGLPDFVGGILGFWSYDVARSLEKLPLSTIDDLQLPDYVFGRYEQVWIVDQWENAVYCAVHTPLNEQLTLEQQYGTAKQQAMEMEQQWKSWIASSRDEESSLRHQRMQERMEQDQLHIDVENLPGLTTSMSKEQFKQAVRGIQHYIGQGDVFQVNLSLRQSRQTDTSPTELYEWLRLVNPSPYMGLLRTPDFALVSASPELLVKLNEGHLSARPIAGTRRRGRTSEEDHALEVELLSSEKERAEHVMLVDLERNDLGRVAQYGTVKVPELMTVERYSHVMHLVSQVEARLAAHKDALDVLAATFPGGTITGAPKIRTMEIIEELEPTRRGPYTGSMGWIDYSGNMEFNIIIRTITLLNGICHIQAGAGIVIDSDPEREFHESLNKAKALWIAVQYSEGQEEPK
jgi:para-aminobenzoate synthetase component 1